MDDVRRCRLSIAGEELELAGPPSGLRALSRHLRRHAESPTVTIAGGSVTQEVSAGPLLVSLRGATTLHFSGSRDALHIIWQALDGVADEAMTAEDQRVNRHQHIEHFPGDEYRSPDSIPLVIVADWPEPPTP